MPNINRIHLPDGNTYDLVKKELTQAEYDALTEEEKNNGTMYCITDSSSHVDTAFYGVCNTGADVAEKEVSISGFSSTNLIAGVSIRVLFINSNSATSPTLNVSGTGAKLIYRYGTVSPSTNPYESWNNNQVISFTYDGTSWRMVDYTQYGWVKVFDQRTSNYGKFYFTETNGIKIVRIVDPKNLTAKAYTTLDFTLPTNFRPQMDVYETLFVPSANDVAIRFNIKTDGTVLIYNYSTATGTLNIANTMTYV